MRDEIKTTLDEITEQCPDGRTTCTGCPYQNGGYCEYFDMGISQVGEYLKKLNHIAEDENTNIFNQSDLEAIIKESMHEASAFDLRGWFLPIDLNLKTLEFSKPSWNSGNSYTPGFLTVCKVGMFDPEGENIEELIEIHLGNAQNNIENYFAVQKGKKVVWI